MSNPITNAKKTVLVQNMFYESVIGNNLMMLLYFSSPLECTEVIIDNFGSAAFLKSVLQRWP